MKKYHICIFILSIIFSTKAFTVKLEGTAATKQSPYFDLAIGGVYASKPRKLTLDSGFYWVLEKERLTDSSSILGPTISGSISQNSISASLGFGKISSVSMFGAYGAQLDYSYLRLWHSDLNVL